MTAILAEMNKNAYTQINGVSLHLHMKKDMRIKSSSLTPEESIMSLSYNLESAEPFFAPLSKPMIEKAIFFQEREINYSAPFNLCDAITTFTMEYAFLRQRIAEPRREIFDLMHPLTFKLK